MNRSHLLSIITIFIVLLAARRAAADEAADRAAVADAFGKLADYAESLATTAGRSEDRAVRKRFAPRATEVGEDLENLARRTRKDVGYAVLAKETLTLAREAATLPELADEASDKAERKSLRAQAQTLEQSVSAMHKILDALAAKQDKPEKPAPMRAAAFAQLLETIGEASFDKDKVEVVRHAAQTNWFLASQVASVMDLLSFDDGKIDAAAAMWPKITDPENSFVIFNKLTFDSSKEKLRKRVGK